MKSNVAVRSPHHGQATRSSGLMPFRFVGTCLPCFKSSSLMASWLVTPREEEVEDEAEAEPEADAFASKKAKRALILFTTVVAAS